MFRLKFWSVFLLLLISSLLADDYWKDVESIRLEMTTLVHYDSDNEFTPVSRTATYDFNLPNNVMKKIPRKFIIGELQESIDGCLDGLGSDVSFIIIRENMQSPDEIFFGCNDYSKGTLRKGNNYNEFWDVFVSQDFQLILEDLIKKTRTGISEAENPEHK